MLLNSVTCRYWKNHKIPPKQNYFRHKNHKLCFYCGLANDETSRPSVRKALGAAGKGGRKPGKETLKKKAATKKGLNKAAKLGLMDLI
jgi:hypothetical protein